MNLRTSLVDAAFPAVTLHDVPANVPARVLAAVALPPDTPAIGTPTEPHTKASRVNEVLHDHVSFLSNDERAIAESLIPSRRASFVAGRIALRAAISAVHPSLNVQSMPRTARGAPLLPRGVGASISHKQHVAVALASEMQDDNVTIGVDIEDIPTERDLVRPDIGQRILTEREHERVASLDPLAYRRATVTAFAIKEAIYKAIDPHVQRYVGFTEVELDVDEDGAARVSLLLPEAQRLRVSVQAAWWTVGSHILAAVAIRSDNHTP